MEKIIIEKAFPKDAKSIKKLLHKTWIESYSDVLSKEKLIKVNDHYFSEEVITDYCNDRDVFVKVARNSHEQVIGVIIAKRKKGILLISQIYIEKKYQGQGIGRSMFDDLLTYCGEIKKIWLEVGAFNKKAIAFYEKSGFKNVKTETKKFFDDEVEIFIMEKVLKS